MIFGELPRLHPLKFKFESPHKSVSWIDMKGIYLPRMEYAASLPIKHLTISEPNESTQVIVGAGPTLDNYVEILSELGNKPGYALCAINKMHDFLVKNEIIPNFQIIFEYDIENVEQVLGGPPHKDVTYYVCSHCHENVFKQLKDFNCVLYHSSVSDEAYTQTVKTIFPDEPLVGADSGYITFFRALAVGNILGYRKYELYGIDSSFEESDHIDGYKDSDAEPKIHIWGKKKTTGEFRKFRTNGTLAWQAYRFMLLCEANPGLKLIVHGDNLLRYVHQGRYPEYYK